MFFIDLPTFPTRQSEAPKEEKGAQKLSPGFLSNILENSALCLRLDDEFCAMSGQVQQVQMRLKTVAGRYVLIGGPGQGKSTLSQFLCQIHRANLLKDCNCLDPDVKDYVLSITRMSHSQGLEVGIARGDFHLGLNWQDLQKL